MNAPYAIIKRYYVHLQVAKQWLYRAFNKYNTVFIANTKDDSDFTKPSRKLFHTADISCFSLLIEAFSENTDQLMKGCFTTYRKEIHDPSKFRLHAKIRKPSRKQQQANKQR